MLLLALAACGDRSPIVDVPLRITAEAGEVELGKAFQLTVVRVWPKRGAPDPWSDAALAPLEVRLEETTRREDESNVEETRNYQGYTFSLGDLTEPVQLRIKRALDPARPGPAELPEPLSTPFPWLWSTLGAIALGVAFLLLRRRRSTPIVAPPEPPAEPPPGPHVRALERLARLSTSHDEFYLEGSVIVREYSGERFGVAAMEMTTEQLSAVVAPVAEILRPCDLVKFARHRSAPPERDRWLEAAERFVRETA